MTNHSDTTHGSLMSYIIGFLASLILTLSAYFLIAEKVLGGWAAVLAITGLALIQLLVQLVCFLHLGREAKPRWNLQVFLFMLVVVGIVVFGSLWIMNNLAYHHGHDDHAHETDEFIIKDEGYQQKP